MRRTLTVVALVLCGIVGAWVGYWVGYQLGWSEGAIWPWTVGGGTGAILLSIGVSVLFVFVAGLIVVFAPQRDVRHLLRTGAAAPAVVVSARETGAVAWAPRGTRHQVAYEFEVRPPAGPSYRARSTQFVSEAAERALQPGATVAIRYDLNAPTHVAIEEPQARAA